MNSSKVHPFLFLSETEKKLIPNLIVRVVGEFYNLLPNYYRNKTQKKEFIRARHVSAYMIKYNTNLSLSKIGMYIGPITHASALHAIKTIKNESSVDHILSSQLKHIQSVILNEISSIINHSKEKAASRQCMINLNDFTSFALEGNKFILAVGFDERELNIVNTLLATKQRRDHINTGLLIVDDNTTQG